MRAPTFGRSLAAALLLTLVTTASADAQSSALVDFSSGAEGWSINGIDTIVPTDGNPTAHIRYPNVVDTFGIALRNGTHPAFLGDYGTKGDVTLSFDMKVEFITFFGSPVGRELVVILYDDDDQGPSGPAGVWTSLGVLDGNGMPWTNFSIDVIDATSTTLPAGWSGRGDEDPGTFEPILPAGSTWASVLAGVDRIEFTTFVPGFFFGFTNFDVRADNVSIQPLVSNWTDLGSALAGTYGDPALTGSGSLVVGDDITLSLTNALENTTTYLVFGVAAINAPFKGGTLVPAISPPFGLYITLATDGAGNQLLVSPWPAGVPSGTNLFFQHWTVDPAGPVGLSASNAVTASVP